MSASTPLLIELLLLVLLNCVLLPTSCAHWLGPSDTVHWATNRTWGASGPVVLDPFLRAELAAPSPTHVQQHVHQQQHVHRYEYSSTPDGSHSESSGGSSSGDEQVQVLRARRASDGSGMHTSNDDSPTTLHIAGFLGRSRGALHAVHLALQAVNARRDILGPYRLAFLDTLTMARPSPT